MVHCGSGTYIRSFAHDLGQKLGCGAYVEDLRRTKIASLQIEDSIPLQNFTPQNWREHLHFPEEFLKDFPRCELTEEESFLLGQGRYLENRWKLDATLAFAMLAGRSVGLLEPCEGGALIKFAKRFVFD